MKSTQKLPSSRVERRVSPRMKAAATAMPMAAETKFSRASASIWVR